MRTSTLERGQSLPALELMRAGGGRFDLDRLLDAGPIVMYFMRTPTCPVCHSHLRQMERANAGARPISRRVVIVVPSDPDDAAAVASRHPELADRIVSSTDAHEAVGLFVRAGLQRSGTFIIDRNRRVLSARSATIPLDAYDEAEVTRVLRSDDEVALRAASPPAERS